MAIVTIVAIVVIVARVAIVPRMIIAIVAIAISRIIIVC
jgi:hypothetical protein